jgi:hypothetical protein
MGGEWDNNVGEEKHIQDLGSEISRGNLKAYTQLGEY